MNDHLEEEREGREDTLFGGTLKKLSLWSQTTNLESRNMVINPYGV